MCPFHANSLTSCHDLQSAARKNVKERSFAEIITLYKKMTRYITRGRTLRSGLLFRVGSTGSPRLAHPTGEVPEDLLGPADGARLDGALGKRSKRSKRSKESSNPFSKPTQNCLVNKPMCCFLERMWKWPNDLKCLNAPPMIRTWEVIRCLHSTSS